MKREKTVKELEHDFQNMVHFKNHIYSQCETLDLHDKMHCQQIGQMIDEECQKLKEKLEKPQQ
jgi:hypothetical protein